MLTLHITRARSVSATSVSSDSAVMQHSASAGGSATNTCACQRWNLSGNDRDPSNLTAWQMGTVRVFRTTTLWGTIDHGNTRHRYSGCGKTTAPPAGEMDWTGSGTEGNGKLNPEVWHSAQWASSETEVRNHGASCWGGGWGSWTPGKFSTPDYIFSPPWGRLTPQSRSLATRSFSP